MRQGILLTILVAAIACSPEAPEPDADGTWVGTITTESNVTTVVNESGSVWEGMAKLVEEASIGIDIGPDEEMFGYLHTITANRERIVIVDSQAAAVRMYDHDGNFLGNVGGVGQGPGEYTRPRVAAIDEVGRVYVREIEGPRINVYAPDGTPLEAMPATMACCGWPMYPSGDGSLWLPVEEINRETRARRYGVQSHGPGGPQGEVLWVPEIGFERITYSFNGREMGVPLGPRLTWGPTPSGGVFVGGTDRYRFEVHERDGSVLAIERVVEPVAYPPEEIEWNRRRTMAGHQSQLPGWSWDGAEIPTHKSAFGAIVPVRSGGYWVRREGASRKVSNCTEDPLAAFVAGEARLTPCWESEVILDAFDETGRYLGSIESPEVMGAAPLLLYVSDDLVVTGWQDDQGVYRVKRYRLVASSHYIAAIGACVALDAATTTPVAWRAMDRRSFLIAIAFALAATVLVASCGPLGGPLDPDGTWVGTITTEGNVTTVSNEAGSVWGGTATLVEEASIGVASGADEYMLGQISSVFATSDRIYIADPQVPAVRMYDFAGQYVGDLGGRGQGPGEYTRPEIIGGFPDGRLFVFEREAMRFNIYSADGIPIGTWPALRAHCCDKRFFGGDGDTLLAVLRGQDGNRLRTGVQTYGPDGPQEETRWPDEVAYTPLTYRRGGEDVEGVPFRPGFTWEMTPAGDIVAGATERYYFEVQRADGSCLHVEKVHEPVPIPPERIEYERRRVVGLIRELYSPGWNWDGEQIPLHQPAFSAFVTTSSGEIWLTRPGDSRRIEGCIEDPLDATVEQVWANPCWKDIPQVDAFAADGRFLGAVDVPVALPAFSLYLSVRNDVVVAVIMDDDGVVRVKRFRMVVPGG